MHIKRQKSKGGSESEIDQDVGVNHRRANVLHGQVGQAAVDIALCKLPGMPVLVKLDVPADPMHVGFFGAPAVMANPENLNHAVVEPGCGPIWKPEV